MKKILLIHPPYLELYQKSTIKFAVPLIPSLTLATIASPLIQAGHEVEILDCNVVEKSLETEVESKVDSFQPDYIGVTFPTPQYRNMQKIC
ncbi:MAG: radical SAM protein, partial [Methanobacteriota archaeon]